MLQEQGEARRWDRAPARLGEDVDPLVLWQPDPIGEKDWQQLMLWVGKGHRLVLAGNNGHLPSRAKVMALSAPANKAVPAAPDPLTAGVAQVSVGVNAFSGGAGALPLLQVPGQNSPVLLTWSSGKGRIYWSADTSWLTNGTIAEDDNLTVALRLLHPAPGKQAAFDEYHHGLGAPERWLQVLRGPLRWFVVQLALALALLTWAYGVRFGAPVPEPAGPPRASVEYVYSMSQLYRRAGARREVLSALYRQLRRTLGRGAGGATGRSDAELARIAARPGGATETEIAALLARTAPERNPLPSDAELLALAQAGEALQRSVRNAGQSRPTDRPASGSDPAAGSR